MKFEKLSAFTGSVAAIALLSTPAYGQTEDELAIVNAAALIGIQTCRAGLNALEPTLYTYSPGVKPTDMTKGMAEFQAGPLPVCRAVGQYIDELADVSVQAAVALNYGGHERVEKWSDYFDGAFGIESMGSRMVIHCPQNHKIQFDCVSGLERVKLSSANLHEQLDLIENMVTKPAVTPENFFEAEVVEKESLGDSCRTFLETPSPRTGGQRAKIDFGNETGEDRIVSWINYDGDVNPGKVVKANTSYTGLSSIGHRFVVMDSDLNCTMTIIVSADNANGELK